MKCNPLRWLFGLLPLAILWWIGVLGNQPRIEEDLAQRSGEVLDRAGLSWAKAGFKGRDSLLVGRAEEESEQRRAAIEVAKVWGVRAIEDRTEVLELIKNFVWQASLGAGDVKLTGYVPNEAARKAVLASLRSALPNRKVDDQLKLARGAPEQKLWLSGTNFALRQLASLKPGGSAGLEGTGLVIQGEAQTSRTYETVRTALASLPQGISLKSDKVTAPLVKPFTWSAALRGRQVELKGYVPSTEARKQIAAAVSSAVKGAVVVDDHTAIASGAPANWQRMALAAVAKLGQLKQGTAESRDSDFSIAGLTETAEGADAVKRALRTEIPTNFRITEQIRQDPAVVAAEEARRAAEAAARLKAAEDARRAAEAAEARRLAEQQKAAAEEAARRAAAEAAQRDQSMTEAARRKAEEDARRAADAAAKERAAADALRSKAEEDARRAAAAAAAAEARRVADLQRQQAEEASRRKAEEDRVRARAAEAQRCQSSLSQAAEAGTITFQRASADLDRRSHQTLDALAQIMKSCPGFAIEVEGHTDNEGEPDRNQRLSERRASSVRDYLVRVGVPESSLKAIGYGEVKPKVPNDSPANMARNRRIEFSVKTK